MKRKVHEVRLEREFIAHHITVGEFDALLDRGVDDILIITPKGRWLSSLDEWLDYGYVDVDNDESGEYGTEIRVLHRSYMGRV